MPVSTQKKHAVLLLAAMGGGEFSDYSQVAIAAAIQLLDFPVKGRQPLLNKIESAQLLIKCDLISASGIDMRAKTIGAAARAMGRAIAMRCQDPDECQRLLAAKWSKTWLKKALEDVSKFGAWRCAA